LPITNAFDGNLVDSYFSGNGNAQEATFTFDDPIPFTTLKLHYQMNRGGGANSNGCELYINGALVQDTNSEGSAVSGTNGRPVATKDFTSQVTSPITSIGYKYEMNGSQVRIHGIETESGILVDAVNDSQVWSDYQKPYTTSDVLSAWSAGKVSQNNFDGDDATFASPINSTDYILFTPASSLPVNTSLVVYGYELWDGLDARYSNHIDVTVEGNPNPIRKTTPDGSAVTFTAAELGGNVVSIKAQHVDGTNGYASMSAVAIDGLRLVDQGIRDLGATEVTYGPVTGTGVFQVADQLNNTMTIQNSNDRWIDNNNRLSKDFYVRDNITVLNADNAKHVALQQAIADAFDAFPEKVNQRRTSIASSFYRLMGGEALSAGEFQLLEETVIGAVNATEPFALDGFYPLYYTSAKADAASSTDSHHSHTINGVTYYMPDGGTLYHGNYIAPETSTTDNNDSSY
jgi:hypothetical protein